MSSVIFQSFQKKTSTKQGLPVSQSLSKEQGQGLGLHRRLSSISLNIQPSSISFPSAAANSWAFRRSKSFSSMGDYACGSLRKWWDWGCAWMLSRKPTFATDLEMNEEETAVLGCQNKGSWRHVFYKVRSEFRKLLGADNVGLPQTFRYDSLSYSQNFDDGKRRM